MAMLTVGGASLAAATTCARISRASTSARSSSHFAAPSQLPASCLSNFSFCSLRTSAAFSPRFFRQLVRECKSRGKAVRQISRIGAPRCEEGGESKEEKIPFGYTRKDVILIGVGLLVVGCGLKFTLEAFGVDSARAGNAVQLIMVLGLTVGWISSYVFRVSNKDMTYAKQLRDYENKVMQKRLEELPEAELEAMLAQIEEEKRILRESRKNMN